MDFGGGDRHCASDILNCHPRALKISRPGELRNYPCGTLLHHLGNKFVCVEQLAAHSREQTSIARLARVMSDIGDNRFTIA